MDKDREEFLIRLIDLHEHITSKCLELNRELINYLKEQKEPIELTIDSKTLAEKLEITDQSNISQAKHRLFGL
ncbi:TPA: hypothetical protein U9K42_001789 [Streptococcus agalactiae]|uniref:hypothetical protein n=3 Tax=Streptococcus agalactiae TaxID=1311 RepID=UPI0002BBC110|nr:hypothetical protein [Streptococcus agalactiae]EPT98235.1 hypothetical protein SAG0106_05680 [Streptococcus agalactiae BSU165]CNE66375.1 Uncharacterised protein [Streptococcus agalactiae]CNF77750.1 Uncharacterised protein [Streptococcus agalactiae]SIW56588.1 hypothetical protein BQ8897_BM110_00139 [Streptococcus agalactiae]HEN7498464.1 hypothetical protein [Streptococcus agalactiae]